MVGLSGLVDALEKLFKKDVTKAMINEYNTIVTQYAYLNVPLWSPSIPRSSTTAYVSSMR